jgi:DNA-binding beta-propeller fold protein YncE
VALPAVLAEWQLDQQDGGKGGNSMRQGARLALFVGVTAALLFGASLAEAQFLVIGDDNKLHWDDAGKPVFTEPGGDEVVIVDISNREQPTIAATLPLMNTVVGPPTNLAVTPDEKLALVANSLAYQQEGAGFKPSPDNKIHVIDLTAKPPRLVATVEVGKQPSGMAISRAGDLALVANRADNSVSVLSIESGQVKVVDTVALGDTVSAVAITPDGKHALVTKHAVSKVAWLDIEGSKVSYQKRDLSVGVWPYNVQVTADGRFALTANQGNGGAADGGAGSVTVIDLKADPPHVVDYLGVDPLPEGLDMSPVAPLAVVVAINGSAATPKGAWFAKPHSILDVLSTSDGRVRKVGDVKAGRLAEGIAFSPDGGYLYVGNFVDSDLEIYKVEGDTLRDTGKMLKLPGHPASVRGSTP